MGVGISFKNFSQITWRLWVTHVSRRNTYCGSFYDTKRVVRSKCLIKTFNATKRGRVGVSLEWDRINNKTSKQTIKQGGAWHMIWANRFWGIARDTLVNKHRFSNICPASLFQSQRLQCTLRASVVHLPTGMFASFPHCKRTSFPNVSTVIFVWGHNSSLCFMQSDCCIKDK